jgi:NAD(P)H-hydrate epimerase
MEKEDIRDLLPVRRPDGHKGTFGKILIFAGSEGMTGAAYLCALSAYRTGSGLIKLAVPKSIGGTMSMLIPEAVQAQIPEKDGHSCLQDKTLLKRLVEDSDVVLFGPGLSCNEDTGGILKALVECCEKPMIIDADGLNLLAAEPSLLENLRCEAVITPHPAEMGRLTGLGTGEVQKDRIGIAKKFADEYGLTVVLKGAGTVIATNDGRIAINPTGNDGMATAGSGDVLAGMIASLLGQGLPTYEAAAAGVYLHGLAGNFAAHDKGTASLIASDIIANIPQAFKEIANG